MSNKITKQRAYDVAKKMANQIIEPKRVELKTQLESLLEPIIISKIPKEIMECFERYPKYISTTHVYRPIVNGTGEFGVSMSKNYPTGIGYSAPIEVTKELYKKMIAIHHKIADLKTKEESLKTNIEATLNQLSTFKRISEKFNEAMPFIPCEWLESTSTAIAIPIENLRNEISQFKVKP